MEGIYLIAVMIVTGGAIAFIGDKLGTKIGKKRLSIFGLRPRHTSMFVTVVTGGLITALSIGFMALISDNVRTALFGMEELRQTMNSTLAELDAATENLFKAQEEFERANTNLKESKIEIASLKTEQEELRAESDRLKEGNEQLEATNSELTAANSELESANSELAAQNENLSDTNAALEETNKKLGDFNVTLTELEERNKNLREGLIAIREGDITLRAGEVLAVGVIRGGLTADEISDDINALAEQATQNLIERFGGGEENSVWIYQPELHRVIDEIETGGRDMVLRISAAGNLVRGEPVRTRLELFPNELIFSKGERILSKAYEINDDNPPETILRDFLTEINHIATEKGVLADPLTGSVGRMEGTQLYDIVESLLKAKSKVQLTATARDETTSQGPLRLNIKVEQR